MSSVARASKYTYRASSGGIADVNIEYSADLTALTRLEVKNELSNYSIDRIDSDNVQWKNGEGRKKHNNDRGSNGFCLVYRWSIGDPMD